MKGKKWKEKLRKNKDDVKVDVTTRGIVTLDFHGYIGRKAKVTRYFYWDSI